MKGGVGTRFGPSIFTSWGTAGSESKRGPEEGASGSSPVWSGSQSGSPGTRRTSRGGSSRLALAVLGSEVRGEHLAPGPGETKEAPGHTPVLARRGPERAPAAGLVLGVESGPRVVGDVQGGDTGGTSLRGPRGESTPVVSMVVRRGRRSDPESSLFAPESSPPASLSRTPPMVPLSYLPDLRSPEIETGCPGGTPTFRDQCLSLCPRPSPHLPCTRPSGSTTRRQRLGKRGWVRHVPTEDDQSGVSSVPGRTGSTDTDCTGGQVTPS